MQFLKEIEAHLVNFETEVKEEIQKFIAYLHTKYQPVSEAVVPPPAPIAPNGELTIPSVVVPDDTPVVLAQPTIVAEESSLVEEKPDLSFTFTAPKDEPKSTITITPTTCTPADK